MIASLIVSGLLVLAAYLLGSIPTGYLAGSWARGIDIREYGSYSTGATNVLRTLGKKIGISVLLVDIVKGAIAVSLIYGFYAVAPAEVVPASWQHWLAIAAALAAVLGHSKSVWINFTGGKSTATSIGALLVMAPLVALGTIAIFVLAVAVSRIVSLGSLAGAITVNVLMILLGQPLPYLLFAGMAGVYVVLRHSRNIKRLVAGTEPRLGQNLQQETEG